MNLTLGEANTVFLMSLLKPVLFALAVGFWARAVGVVDKDMDYYMLPKWLWQPVVVGAGALAFLLWLLIPYFWLGLLVGSLIASGALVGYATFRNPKVPETARWGISADHVKARIGEMQHAQVQKHATVAFIAADGTKKDVPTPTTPLGEAHSRLEELVEFSLPRGADLIDLVVSAQKALLTVEVDGYRYPQPEITPKLAMALVNYLKTNSGLDVEDLRRKQQGTVTIEAAGRGKHALGLVTMGSQSELRLIIHIDPAKLSARGMNQLGMLPSQLAVLKPAVEDTGRVILVGAPSKEGMTTTLYALLHAHDPYTHNVTTLEDEIAYHVEGVDHQTVEVGTDNMQLSRRLSAALRRSPQVVMMGRPLSSEVVKAIIPEARNLRLYAGVQQGDTFASLAAWVKMAGEPGPAADALGAIVAQRLVRALCKTCRQGYKPDLEALRKLNVPPEKVGQLYKSSGKLILGNKQVVCPDCAGMGFKGRMAIFEVMAMDDPAREMVKQGQMDHLRAHLRKQQKMIWLQEAALVRVLEGATSIGEVNRVLAGVRPAGPGGSAAGIAGPTAPGGSSGGSAAGGSASGAIVK
ncbi:MAG: Flp pilus assembly complex ATPase component TadA [Phycisphaeraceae bacterium]|nr:Flp pilus assembly complex ATPase component TadA [Phycisphaeraceae bacterium]